MDSLEPALVLLRHAQSSEAALDDVLGALEQASTTILEGISMGAIDPEQCYDAVEDLAAGLAAVQSLAVASSAQLPTLSRPLWSQAVLPLVACLFHSPAWYALSRADEAGAEGPFFRARSVALDSMKRTFLPLLREANAQQQEFQLEGIFRALADMASTASSIAGARDDQYAAYPQMSYYGLVGVIWNVQCLLWKEAPAAARTGMAAAGLGGEWLVQQIAVNMAADLATLQRRMSTADVKLLLFWTPIAHRMLQGWPETAPTAWPSLLRYACGMRDVQAALAAEAEAGDEGAAAAAEQLVKQEGQAKACKLLAWCLNAMPDEADVRAAVDGLRGALADARPSAGRGAQLLSAVLGLLAHASLMSARVRRACLALLDAAAGSLAGPAYLPALESAALRREMTDSLLAFLAACCSAALQQLDAAGQEGGGSGRAQQREAAAAQQTWALCQQRLFRLAVQPHPLIAQVLGEAWADLVATAEEPLARQHIMLLADLLQAAAAAEAASGLGAAAAAVPAPPSPLQLQLTGLLACLLLAVPVHVRDGFFANYLAAADVFDSCKLAALAAQLQLAALVDGGAKAAGGALVCTAAVASAMQQLQGAVEGGLEPVLHAMAASAPATCAEVSFWLAQLLEALRGGAAYLLATESPPPPARQMSSLAAAATRLLVESPAPAAAGFAVPALGLLCALRSLSSADVTLLSEPQLVALLPRLVAWAGRPELAAAVAGLAAAFKACSAEHAELFHALLARGEPLAAHAAMAAFADYSMGAPAAHVLSAVPPALQDPASGTPSPAFASMLGKYLSRALPLDAQPPSAAATAGACAPALHDSAGGAVAQLLRAMEAARAAPPPAPLPALPAAAAAATPGQEQLRRARVGPATAAAAATEELEEADDVGAAAQDVVRAIKAVEAALRRGGRMEPAAAKLLGKCAGKLEQLCHHAG